MAKRNPARCVKKSSEGRSTEGGCKTFRLHPYAGNKKDGCHRISTKKKGGAHLDVDREKIEEVNAASATFKGLRPGRKKNSHSPPQRKKKKAKRIPSTSKKGEEKA